MNLIRHGYYPISLDETGYTVGESEKFCWTKIGEPPHSLRHNPNTKLNIIAAITYHGLVCFEAHRASTNQIYFLSFLIDLLNYLDGDFGVKDKKFFLIYDNAAFHRSKVVRSLIAKRNIPVLHTPAYYPFFAPIELYFNHIKQLLRKSHINNMYFFTTL